MSSCQCLDRLVGALRLMPGIGQRSASRIAFYLLAQRREDGVEMARTIGECLTSIRECKVCRNYSDGEVCAICATPARLGSGVVCVVETPADVQAVEDSGEFHGRYFVLHGHLSPLDGIGPEDLGLGELEEQLRSGGIRELVLATNPTVEGDATAAFIAQVARRHQVAVSKIAAGVPIGGELDTVDGGTLGASLRYRRPFAG
ncbi:MAG: recombination mediator RecR [Succinivibrionaceae bacterium]|nr:recombination mediator RecR [Succinivibrionaceae bacterium]